MIETVTSDGLQAVDVVWYIRSRWRFVALSCASALLLAGLASLVLPKRYTATASLIIEPPAGMDPRSATALSPVYLESLKTYERLASSDTLFLNALEYLRLRGRYASRSVEALKRSVLKVSRPVNTRVIEISATLDDPREAQQLASYIAQQASALNKTIEERSAAGAAKEAQANLQHAEERLHKQQSASDEFVSAAAGLDAELSNATELKFRIERDISDVRTELAGEKADMSDIASARAKLADLQQQARQLEQKIASTAVRFERARQRRDTLDADLKTARTSFEAARARLDEINAAAAFRGERLEVLDPGIVPQRASFPNAPLNLIAALLISLIAAITYLTLCFGLARVQHRRSERTYNIR